MDMDELEKLEKEIATLEKAKQEIVAKRRASALQEVVKQIAQYRFTVKELGLDRSAERKIKRPKAEPKYVNPNNPAQTWAGGKGAVPKWVKEHENAGGKREDFLIK